MSSKSKSRKSEETSKTPTKASRSVAWPLVKTVAVVLALTTVAVIRILNDGAHIPKTCSVFGYDCDRRYNVPFSGYVHEDYVAAEEAFKQNFYRGDDVGASAAAYVDGKLVLDVQGGWQDVENQIPYTKNSLQMVFSCTKALAYIVVAHVVDTGALSYDEKIATYWPEFAQGNKENVTLGDLMQHSAGVSIIDTPLTSEAFEDPVRRARILAAQPHNFQGVATRSYHGATQGWYINEILIRVTNRTVNDYATDWNKQYGIEWNLKPYQEEYDERIAHFYSPPTFYYIYKAIKLSGGVRNFIARARSTNRFHTQTLKTVPDADSTEGFTTLRLRRIESPAYTGYTNSYSIAKLAAMMANRGKAIVDGEPDLMNSETYTMVTEKVPEKFDIYVDTPVPSLKGGWGITDDFVVEGVQFVGWMGMGGSVFWWNDEHKIGFGYSMNAMLPTMIAPDKRSMSILTAIVKQVLAKKA